MILNRGLKSLNQLNKVKDKEQSILQTYLINFSKNNFCNLTIKSKRLSKIIKILVFVEPKKAKKFDAFRVYLIVNSHCSLYFM